MVSVLVLCCRTGTPPQIIEEVRDGWMLLFVVIDLIPRLQAVWPAAGFRP